MPRFAIGIDLGTTNCAMASVDLTRGRGNQFPQIETFSVPQLLTLQESARQPLLPSFAYISGPHEVRPDPQLLPWHPETEIFVGEAAHRQGGLIPARLVASAKSWLCHAGIDRKAAILPWNAEESVQRMSPVEASARYLEHLRLAWNTAKGSDNEADRLENQRVVLTVPASFDEVARDLTVEAAEKAGLKNFTLLEEPQAAFYHWLYDADDRGERRHDVGLPVGSVCLVVDCGGGTTDFSLIAVVEKGGSAEFERLAVGDHLLLGGDNMDVALARHVEQVLSPNRRLDSTQWGNLLVGCRRIKEKMLGPNPPASEPLAVIGRGSKIIGSTLSCQLDRQTVHQICLDGFFPNVGFGEDPLRAGRTGLSEFGLPYVADPSITRHLAYFLRQHGEAIRSVTASGEAKPTAILFNGGVFNAEACRRQLLHVMRCWYGASWEPTVLNTSSLDLAVARGAAAFAWAKERGAKRIKSGAARSYYVGVAAPTDNATKQTVLCIVPHGLDEGQSVRIDQVPLTLQLGQPVIFPMFTSTVRTHDQAGEVLEIEPGQLGELPSLTTVLRGGRRSGAKEVAVFLESKLTEIGTIELHCAAKDGQNRWKLQFQARLVPTRTPDPAEANPGAPGDIEEGTSAASNARPQVTDTWSEEQLSGARQVLQHVLGEAGKGLAAAQVAGIGKQLEAALGMSRSQWPMAVLRALWDTLHELAPFRGQSAEHEQRWQNLVGQCLRPGWGDPLDPFRVEQLWKVIHQGPIQIKSDAVWTEYWILTRRVAGGLDANRQIQLSKRMLGYVQSGPGGKKPPRRISNNELTEVWRAIASLEHLTVPVKVQLGHTLVKSARKKPVPRYVFWALTRLGSRVPLYGPANVVVGADTAAKWAEQLLSIQGDNSSNEQERLFALAQIARCSGDRTRDLPDDLRQRIADSLDEHQAKPHWSAMVREVTELDQAEQGQLLGDALPPGLKLAVNDG